MARQGLMLRQNRAANSGALLIYAEMSFVEMKYFGLGHQAQRVSNTLCVAGPVHFRATAAAKGEA